MRILLVEDDAWVANVMQSGLESEGYHVDIAVDGRMGIDTATTQSYDLILLDIQLPIIDGFEVCRQLRKCGVQTPILVVTARAGVDDKVHGLQIGADDYLTKPFVFKELLARALALLRRQRAMELAPVIQVADLCLNKNTREVTRAHQSVALTPREFAILECLMVHAGRAVSRTTIETHVFGEAHDSATNLIDVYIRRLRQKIDHGFAPGLIHTIRGIGYMMKA